MEQILLAYIPSKSCFPAVVGNGGSLEKCRRRWDLVDNQDLKYKWDFFAANKLVFIFLSTCRASYILLTIFQRHFPDMRSFLEAKEETSLEFSCGLKEAWAPCLPLPYTIHRKLLKLISEACNIELQNPNPKTSKKTQIALSIVTK